MKPVFAKVLEGSANKVYDTRVISRPWFSTEFHFHTECQMSYVTAGEGARVIGDHIENYSSGDLIFLGSDIPHVWLNDKTKIQKNAKRKNQARSVALFFDPDRLLQLLSGFYTTKKLEQVLQKARRGMKFHGQAKEQLKKLLFKMTETEGAGKMILLLQLLQVLTDTKEYRLLAGTGYVNTYQARDNERIDRVFKYLFDNYSGEIKLEDVAALANMNKQAFCRFFKARTQKTLTGFINEIRISQSIRLMNEKDAAISAIAYESGYNSLSNFNKFFKQITGKKPLEYRRQT